MKVKKIEGETSMQSENELRLQHWTQFSKQNAKVCAAKSCINTDLVGGVVIKTNSDDPTTYVVPLCHMHNAKKESFELITGTYLVPATSNFNG